ncbi:hypothetical protein HC928_06755 [bacterium]|nr:hypothetical protein [bacterium]
MGNAAIAPIVKLIESFWTDPKNNPRRAIAVILMMPEKTLDFLNLRFGKFFLLNKF